MITNPREQLIELLTCTQRHWLVAMEYPRTQNNNALHFAASYFSAAWYLYALIEGKPVDDTCEHLAEILNDGGGVGEWTWDMLTRLGVDPATITPEGVKPAAPGVVGNVVIEHHPI